MNKRMRIVDPHDPVDRLPLSATTKQHAAKSAQPSPSRGERLNYWRVRRWSPGISRQRYCPLGSCFRRSTVSASGLGLFDQSLGRVEPHTRDMAGIGFDDLYAPAAGFMLDELSGFRHAPGDDEG